MLSFNMIRPKDIYLKILIKYNSFGYKCNNFKNIYYQNTSQINLDEIQRIKFYCFDFSLIDKYYRITMFQCCNKNIEYYSERRYNKTQFICVYL